jgi:hypothetical protein
MCWVAASVGCWLLSRHQWHMYYRMEPVEHDKDHDCMILDSDNSEMVVSGCVYGGHDCWLPINVHLVIPHN